MFPTKRQLLLGLAVCAVLLLASLGSHRLTPAHTGVAVSIEGSFTRDGQFPGEPYPDAVGVRAWGSWSGSDDNLGKLTIGPFPAPRLLRFGLGGYPDHAGNTLHVELVGTKEQREIKWAAVGERWQTVDVTLDPAWIGRPVQLVAVDQAKGGGGWLSLTEPIRGGRGDGNHALLASLTAWAVNGLLLALIYGAALRWLRERPTLAPPWVPLGAGAIVALAGYAVFWIYFLNSLAGVIASWAVLGVAAAVIWRAPGRHDDTRPADRETRTVLTLTAIIGAFYLAVLHLFPSSHDFYTIAGNRFRESLPGDNYLSHVFAERLFSAQPLKNPVDEWLSSDRPPLQTGWQLLTWSPGKVLQLDRRSVGGTAAMWFQLLWVAGAYGLLRTFQIAPRRAAGWVAALALTGFFLQNTTFTWPKLASGSFGLGAFALLFLAGARGQPRTHAIWAAVFGALAWLAHGGVAFSFLGLLPLLAWRWFRGELRAWPLAAAAFALLAAPWLAYQKFYDPPGTKLLKWHLAGVTQTDPRGTWETIRDSYAQVGAKTAWANKVSNLHGQTLGEWRQLVDLSSATATERRTEEFFRTGRALTWWLPVAALALVVVRRRAPKPVHDLALLGGWLALTVVIWCLLLFGTYQAVIHHGSYAMMLGLFVFFTVLIERSGRGWLPVVALLQAVTLGTTWIVGNGTLNGEPAGWYAVAAGGVALAWYLGRALRAAPAAAAEAQGIAASGPVDRWRDAFLGWWREPRLNLWVWLAIAGCFVLRKPHALHTPQLWAEDGSIFLMQADMHGLEAFTLPYMGYLHTLPRLIAWTGSNLLDPAWWPAFYNGVAVLIWIAAAARFVSPRFDFPGKPWLALSLVAVPHMGEVFFNVTNLQWVTALVLVQQAMIAPPTNARERWGDFAIVVLITLTGPFGIAFLPLFAWRWWRSRDRDPTILLLAMGACAALQAWFVVRTGPRFEFQGAPWHVAPIIEVLGRRLVLWPLLGREIAYSLSPLVVMLAGGTFLAAAFGWMLRPHPRRLLRAQVVAALVLITLAGVYRTRPDAWAGDNLDFADRYFYIPRVLLAWLLIWEFDTVPRAIANLARVFCLAVLLVHIREYTLPAPKDYAWATHVEPIRRGVPAKIPTLPEGWTMEYSGRPEGRR